MLVLARCRPHGKSLSYRCGYLNLLGASALFDPAKHFQQFYTTALCGIGKPFLVITAVIDLMFATLFTLAVLSNRKDAKTL